MVFAQQHRAQTLHLIRVKNVIQYLTQRKS